RTAQDIAREMQNRMTVLESNIAQSRSQQAALEQLYQELSRSRDEWALAETEQVLAIASQQLQLAGNVQGAILALQTADARLARPRCGNKRRLISSRLRKKPNAICPASCKCAVSITPMPCCWRRNRLCICAKISSCACSMHGSHCFRAMNRPIAPI